MGSLPYTLRKRDNGADNVCKCWTYYLFRKGYSDICLCAYTVYSARPLGSETEPG